MKEWNSNCGKLDIKKEKSQGPLTNSVLTQNTQKCEIKRNNVFNVMNNLVRHEGKTEIRKKRGWLKTTKVSCSRGFCSVQTTTTHKTEP
jgi:hypothetical protein